MKKYLLYALTGVLLTACGKEETIGPDGPQTPGEGEIRFEIGIAPQSGVEAGPQTRVVTDEQFKCTWEAGDEIGIFAFAEGTNVTSENYYIENAKLTYNGTSWTSAEPLYWPKDGKKLRFYACYPYNAMDGVKGFDFNVKTDQRADTDGKSNLDLSDVMLTYSIWLPSGSPVELWFSHYACMVELKLDNTVGAIDPNEEVIVKMRDIAIKASFTFQSLGWKAMSGTDKADITMRRVEQPDDDDYRTSYTFRAIVPLQRPEDERSLFHIANGDLRLYSSKQTLETKIGRVELFTQKLPPYIHTKLIPSGSVTLPEGKVIKVANDFRMGRYEVTRTQYAAFLNDVGEFVVRNENHVYTTSKNLGIGEKDPLFMISEWGWTPQWNDEKKCWEAEGDVPMIEVTFWGAKAFAIWAGGYLVSQETWEYACRGMTTTLYWNGDNKHALQEKEWVSMPDRNPRPIGTKSANPFGLYDMHGNVCEWAGDGKHVYGGSVSRIIEDSTSEAIRTLGGPAARYPDVGFRMAFHK